ncbi:alpha-2-macroglobulin-like protein 1 isoform X3 [Trachemys scripta elegans]|uniref:alpha-2-macroglobulin-like protein 1 isoform X3 n=2 Tax=Trachemys scripta elegans TaxID=31138 RepID=UPI001554575D|nr:alpha-2-macroglobulin-like protein 1 isoform X3 [Trachemys scripta elegans]
MWLLLLSTLALLLQSAVTDDPVPNYVVVLPARLSYPSMEKVCMDLSNVKSSMLLTITLETKIKTYKLLDRFVWERRQLNCFSFPVPPPSGGTEEVATIQLSGGGGKSKIAEKKQVLIQRASNSTFVQTDKPIYVPGQLVRFRIVTLNSNFIPLNDKYLLVELKDPENNRIGQWLNVKPARGIVQLSFQLAAEPPLGTYTINVDSGKAYSIFSVEEYVLPKFKVVVAEPTRIFTSDTSFPLKVCGKYTYGKPVQGTVQVSLCQTAYTWYIDRTESEPTDICQNVTGQTDKTGCFSASVDLAFFSLVSPRYSHNINMVATLVEAGTGVEANATHVVFMSEQAGTMSFEDSDNYYHPGYPYSGKIKALDREGSILKKQPIFLVINAGNTQSHQNLTTDSTGVATFILDTATWNRSEVSLEGRFKLLDLVYGPTRIRQYYLNAFLHLKPYYSTTKSYLKIQRLRGVLPCGQKQVVQVDYSIDRMDLGDKAREILFSFYVVGKRKLIEDGQKRVNIKKNGGLMGSFSIPLTFTSHFAPDPSLVVYAMFPDGGVVADKVQFTVSMCFKNQVNLEFSQQQDLPGATVNLQLRAAPNSLCAIRAVDQSVLLLRPERELSNSSVYGMLDFSNGGYPYQVDEYNDCYISRPFPMPVINPVPVDRSKRSIIPRPWFDQGADFFSFLKEMGLKILSNGKIKRPQDCRSYPIWYYKKNILMEAPMPPAIMEDSGRVPVVESQPPSVVESSESQVREFFPETWIWELYPIESSGKKQVPVTLPDTITEWKASMFCTSESSGFGISPTVGLTAFKPFFVDLTLPYSVIRGESFTLTATVFNYLKQCIRIQITLAKSEKYQVKSCKGCEYTSCLCADEARTYYWNVTATKLGEVNFTITTVALPSRELCGGRKVTVPNKGRSDTLIKPLLVRPEGVLMEKSHSSLLCPEGNSASDSVSLQLPEDVVLDSARAQVSVLGDIMGSALQNLDRLVQMPSGCGEQNMVLFAPIIYVLQYLEKTGQLSEELKTRAVGFLQTGYQRQLQYKHRDGSYSAFGESDGEGNTWLTAFVTKCFIQAKRHIFIDDKNIEDALKWIAGNQQANGCYANVGKLFHTAMKGGINDNISLAAYITAALLEAGKPLADPMVKNSLQCLRNASSNATDIYTQALLAYVYSLAGDTVTRQLLLTKLDQQAIKSGGQIHWSRKPAQSPTEYSWSQPKSVDVELTAYVLLALLATEKVSKEEIASATGIVAWLARQQNAYGGFASTQDTVVALQALARYGAVTFIKSGNVSVTVKSGRNFQQSFHVEATNRLVLQQQPLPDIPGNYTIQAAGTGCVYVQTVLRYNVPPSKNAETFILRVRAGEDKCEKQTPPRFLSLNISVSYVGSRGTSNMVIIKLKLLSGFYPVRGTNYFLQQQPFVKRVEIGAEDLTIYLDQLNKETQTYSFTMSQDIPVKDLKPAVVKVYDYYQPDEQATVEYTDPCQ